jgi:hypothetical protein
MRYYSNTAALSTISTSGGISTGATEVAFSTTTGFPSQYPYTLRLDPDTANEELISVTGPKGGSPGVYLITRAQDGTTAKSHAQGAPVVHGVSARDFQEAQNHIAATAVGTHGLPDSAWEQEFTVYKGVDQGYTNDTTLNDDAVLKFSAVANTKYRVELFAAVSGNAGNIKLAWKIPAGATGLRSVLGPAANSTNRDDTNMRTGAHLLPTEVTYGLAADNTIFTAVREHFVVSIGATAGDVVLQHAQSTSSGSQTIMSGASFMVVKKLING